MKAATNLFTRFLLEDDGPTTAEYAILFAFLVVIALASMGGVGNNIVQTPADGASSPGR